MSRFQTDWILFWPITTESGRFEDQWAVLKFFHCSVILHHPDFHISYSMLLIRVRMFMWHWSVQLDEHAPLHKHLHNCSCQSKRLWQIIWQWKIKMLGDGGPCWAICYIFFLLLFPIYIYILHFCICLFCVYFSCQYAEKCKPDQVLETLFSVITKSYWLLSPCNALLNPIINKACVLWVSNYPYNHYLLKGGTIIYSYLYPGYFSSQAFHPLWT